METLLENTSDAELTNDGLKNVSKLKVIKKEIIDGMEKELDVNAKAVKINLTATNVKDIFKQVVTNKHVLTLVRQGENQQATKKLPFESKLTQATAKRLIPLPTISWDNPTSSSLEVQKPIKEELIDDVSGYEYVKVKEESNDDPYLVIVNETKVTEFSLAKKPELFKVDCTDSGILKTPHIKEEETSIALRTKSELSLSPTPSEKIKQELLDENQEDNLNSTAVSLDTQSEGSANESTSGQAENGQMTDVVTITCQVSNLEPSLDVSYNDCFKMDQKLLLEQQICQQIQLLTQHFLLTYQHPEYHTMSLQFKEVLWNYKCLSEYKESSLFNACNLENAFKLIEHWEKQFELNTDEIKEVRECVCRVLQESQTSKSAGIEYIVTFPPLLMETIAKSSVFIYPDLLPRIPFKSALLFNQKVETYTASEDQLIVLGLETFIPLLAEDKSNLNKRGKVQLKKVCGLINTHMLPMKDEAKFYCHVFNSRSPRSNANPIKSYFENKKAPVIIHYVRNLQEFGIVPPCKRKMEMLPHQWKLFLFPNNNQINVPVSLTPSPSLSTTSSVVLIRKRKRGDIRENVLQAAGKTLEKRSRTTDSPNDQWRDFGVFVATSIKNIKNKKLQMECKHKILRIILKFKEEDL